MFRSSVSPAMDCPATTLRHVTSKPQLKTMVVMNNCFETASIPHRDMQDPAMIAADAIDCASKLISLRMSLLQGSEYLPRRTPNRTANVEIRSKKPANSVMNNLKGTSRIVGAVKLVN